MRTFLYQDYYFCGKSTPIQAGYNKGLRVLQLQTLSQVSLFTSFTVPVLWTTIVLATGGIPSIVPQLGNTLQYDGPRWRVWTKPNGLGLISTEI